jgi:hypothetical protein
MSWEDQGRQYHEWFGHGTAPVKLKPIVDKNGSTIEDNLEERFRTVAHGAVGALPRKLRAQAAAQLQTRMLGQLTEAMAAWAYGSKLDAVSFAQHFFGRHADAREVGSLRAAATETVAAETRPQLAAASEHLADAIKVVGVDSWPRFVADAQARAHDKATLAAIKKSQKPVVPVSSAVGRSGSGSVGSGTRLAGGAEEFPFQELMEAHPGILPQGSGAMPEVGAPATEGAAVPAPAEAPVAKQAPADKPAPSASESTSPARTAEGGASEVSGFLNEDGTLLNADQAVIDPGKLANYALAPGNPKATAFRSALGYDASNANDLLAQIRKGVTQTAASPGTVDDFGSRFRVDIAVKGANGKMAIVRTAWIYDPGSHVPRLVTLYVK